MRYVLLIYDEERNWSTLGAEQRAESRREYLACSEWMLASGHYRAGEGLEATATATTVRVRGGAVHTTDGPVADTREPLGGFYLVEAPNLDEAIALASRVPAARTGAVEIRPVMRVATPAAAVA